MHCSPYVVVPFTFAIFAKSLLFYLFTEMESWCSQLYTGKIDPSHIIGNESNGPDSLKLTFRPHYK